MRPQREVRVLRAGDHGPMLPIVEGEGSARAIVWPGVGAAQRSMHRIELAAGSRTIALQHPMEAVYYVIRGEGGVRGPGDGGSEPLVEGSMIHVEPGTAYLFEAGEAGLLILGGPCPADPALYQQSGYPITLAPRRVMEETSMAIRVYHKDKPDLMLPVIAKDARLVVWPGVGAETANMNYVRMEPGEANRPHIHADSEDTIYILEGEGTVEDFDHGQKLDFRAGDVIHVAPGVRHAVAADKGAWVVSVGGPCPADRGMLKAMGALADES